MKKKTYKQMQNRLYREIKRRIEAENRIKLPMDVTVCERPIEKFGLIQRVPNRVLVPAWADAESLFEEQIKKDMAHKIADDLLQKGYFVFCSSGEDPAIFDYTTVRAELNVVRPGKGFW